MDMDMDTNMSIFEIIFGGIPDCSILRKSNIGIDFNVDIVLSQTLE